MIVFGKIKSLNDTTANVEVEEHGNAVYECYILQPSTGKNKVDFPYHTDDLVCVILADRNLILGAIYSDIDTRDADAGEETIVNSAKKIYAKASDLFQFNDGANGGIIKNENLVNNLDKIKTYLTALVSATSTAIGATGATGSAGAKTAFDTAMSSQEITYENMKNDKVKH
ncbi:MAG: hypothetical protein KF872_05860 [Chitinophagales bacterium]|nr:hypothetical protein [Chitinophagales bacterium]